ncbi:MAG: class I SAM-dependent methyltransferase [Anaerolineales bacterium]|nr:class I SAM-dependent methyltransferase [Anaerolineales bacterium]
MKPKGPGIILKPGREKPLLRRHPWVFSGSIARLEGEPRPGETVCVRSSNGVFLALGAYSHESQIRVRVWAWDETQAVNEDFLRERLENAIAFRSSLLAQGATDAVRLVYAEADGIPGLIVDRFGDGLVVQFLSWGAEYWKTTIVQALIDLTAPGWIYERSDADVRELEGLPVRTGLLYGEQPAEVFYIHEYGLSYALDVAGGQKTGFYLDQRDNRLAFRNLAADADVLDCFAYTGGFTLNALAAGAKSVVAVDSSGPALDGARENIDSNELPLDRVELIEGDVFSVLRTFRDEGRSFDAIVLDPPKFAPTSAQVQRAARAYKDVNLLGFKLLRSGGKLVTFSCSGGVDAALFQKIVADAALDAGVQAQIVGYLHQAGDHPVALNFPESAYLKGLVCRIS